MAEHFRRVLLLALCVQGCMAAVLRANLRASSWRSGFKPVPESYSFAQFIRDFDRSYTAGSSEYERRHALFQASLDRIHAVNAKNSREGRAWTSGVHPFMDWSEVERRSLNGYKPQKKAGHTAIVALQTGNDEALHTGNDAGTDVGLNASWGGSDASWEGVALRQQGSCGSCWAISAVEAVEARLPSNTRVSAQALVDCVPNPQHCGGKGGCDGATGELAYTFMKDHGIPLESSYYYTAETGTCPMNPLNGAFPAPQRARVSGWTTLQSNKAQPLLEALYSQGPVVVAVDANDWFDYDQGIFDGCQKDATLGHAVLAKGYGGDGSGKYWRIQNSWGANWGEKGHIRLKRQDAAQEEAYCGQDRKPQEGLGCDGGPSEITVCGMCGILYDPIYPTGVTLEDAAAEPVTHGFRAQAAAVSRDDAIADFEKRYRDEDAALDSPKSSKPEEVAFDLPAPGLPKPFKPEAVASTMSDEDRMSAIFRPERSAADTKSDMEKSAVDRMKEMLSRSRI